MTIDTTQWRLTPVDGQPDGAQTFYLKPGQVFTIGRSPDIEFSVPASSLSRKHAEIEIIDNKVRIKDLGSVNGTFVNNVRITETHAKAGDTVRFKPLAFKIEAPAAGADDKTAFLDQTAFADKTALLNQTEFAKPVTTPHNNDKSNKAKSGAQKDVGNTAIREAIRLLNAKERSKIPGMIFQGLIFLLLLVVMLMSAPASWKEPLYEFKNKLHDRALTLNAPEKIDHLQITALHPPIVLSNNIPLSTALVMDINQDKFLDIVTINQEGHLHAFDGKNTSALQEATFTGTFMAPAALTRYKKQPALVVANQDTTLHILGNDLQEITTIQQPELQNMLFETLTVDINGDATDDLLVTDQHKGISALDGARTGWVLWRIKDQLKGNLTAPPLLLKTGKNQPLTLVVSTDSGQTQAFAILDGQPKLLWSQQTSAVTFASPVAAGNHTIPLTVLLTNNDTLVALLATSGSPKWQKQLADKSFLTPAALDSNKDGTLDIITFGKTGVITALNGDTGKSLWERKLAGELFAAPAIFDMNADSIDDMVIASNDGHVAIISGYDGTSLTEDLLPAQSTQFLLTPILADINNDGMLDVVTISQNNTINIFSSNRPIKSGTQVWPLQGATQGATQGTMQGDQQVRLLP